MDVEILRLAHWSSGQHEAPPGKVPYRLERKDMRKIDFPDDTALAGFAPELGIRVASRGTNHCIILLPKGTKPHLRSQFLASLAANMPN